VSTAPHVISPSRAGIRTAPIWAVTAVAKEGVIPPPKIALILLDIDGVLSAGEGEALDLELLGALAAMNRAARNDPTRPAVTLCSGRPAPYVEVLLQAIDGHQPAVFESGAGLYVPRPYRFLPHPDLQGSDRMGEVRLAIETELVLPGRAFVQPGKIYTLTLFATDPSQTMQLHEWTAEALGPLAQAVDMVYANACLNVLPRGVDKGQGAAFVSTKTGIPLEAMLGVGDSDGDLPLLARVGHSAAPSNANPAVRRSVHYVAPRPTGEGVRDILDHYGLLP